MLNIQLDDKAIEKMADKIADRAYQKLQEKMDADYDIPYVMNREQFMRIFQISPKTFAALCKRRDFPVTRELGGPKILRDDALRYFRSKYTEIQRTDDGYHVKGLVSSL